MATQPDGLRAEQPPRDVCILRLSAIGDTCHVVPLVRTLQHALPGARITWVIGRVEARLMGLLPGVEFITIDKRDLGGARRQLRAAFRGRRFDALLHLQLALRASVLSTAIPARRRIGFDLGRARELQWLFTNERVAARRDQHVLDSFLGFGEALGAREPRIEWNLPLPAEAQAWARAQVADGQQALVISPCSSHALRNWTVAGYAAVAAHAARRHGLAVLLVGGRSELERRTSLGIEAAAGVPVRNLTGQDTLPQLLALLARARVLLSPDSGPAHMATMVGTPVLGLYAATRVARSGPYLSRQWCVDRYAQAARRFLGRPPEALKWAEKIERPGVMELIEPDAVCEQLDRLLAATPAARPC